MSKQPGALAIVLHTHMPYVEGGGPWPNPENPPHATNWEGFGAWPFGEEWLWEAIATSYVPLLDRVLGRGPITLSLTPVLCDQLEAPGAVERCLAFLEQIRPESHRRDIVGFREAGHEQHAAELERSAAEYAAAAHRLRAIGSGTSLLDALGRHATWTSSATHAVLPLLASDAGVSLQVQTGIESHRRRFGEWAGGFWLPECAHAPWLDPLLEEAGARASCVELTGLLGLGDERHLRPLVSDDGPVLWPIDRQTIALVWSERGYPAGAAYRNHHGLTTHHHRVWRNDGGAYDPAAARAQAERDAADFVGRVRARVAEGGVCVFALDTELLGHWWYEGVSWLSAVLDETARQGLELVTLDDALERHEPNPAPHDLGATSWGEGGDLRTWSGPQVADVAWRTRSAELRVLRASSHVGDRALRELLALQSSDWAFLISRGGAGDYPLQRFAGHCDALEAVLAGAEGGGESEGEAERGHDANAHAHADADAAVRNLAPALSGWGD